MFRLWQLTPREGLMIAALTFVSVLIFGMLVGQMVYQLPSSDYSAHIQFARVILDNNEFATTHILYEILVIVLLKLLPITIDAAGHIAATGLYVLTVLVLYGLIRSAVGGRGWGSLVLAAGMALVLLLVAPIILLTIPQQNLYFGYVGLNVYHNPTMVALKPFALLLFAFTLSILNHRIQFSARTIIVGLLFVALSLLAKPNFVLALLPALLVLLAYRMYRRETADIKTALVALVIPMIVILGIEYAIMYRFIDSDTTLIFAPLVTVRVYDASLSSLIIKFFLSILFPAVVYLLYWRKALREMPLNFAWLIFLAGAGQMYLFAETGARLDDGNFWWSAQIGLLVLFVASTLFWLRRFKDRPRWRAWLCLGVLALHLISGLIVYVVQFQSVTAFDWW